MTDNAMAYLRSHAFRQAVTDIGASYRLTRACRPQTNGQAERFNRTLAEEWAYAQVFTSGRQRADALPEFLHRYNYYRAHTTLGGQALISRVNTVSARYI